MSALFVVVLSVVTLEEVPVLMVLVPTFTVVLFPVSPTAQLIGSRPSRPKATHLSQAVSKGQKWCRMNGGVQTMKQSGEFLDRHCYSSSGCGCIKSKRDLYSFRCCFFFFVIRTVIRMPLQRVQYNIAPLSWTIEVILQVERVGAGVDCCCACLRWQNRR